MTDLKQNSLLFDSIPTVLFQVTIFYYDFFLLFCAEKIETVYLKIKREIFFAQYDALGRLCYMINYKTWKDPTTRFLLSIQNMLVVRLIELSVVILLILNIFYASPIWNFIRLAILFSIYSNVAFRSVKDSELVRNRLKGILGVAIFYLWCRVVAASFLDVLKSLRPDIAKNSLIKLLEIGIGEKLILVFEFFLIEYVSSVYFDGEFIKTAEKLIRKKVKRSMFVANCMTYDYNEKKLMAYIEQFSERIQLEKDIMILNNAIEEWKMGRSKHTNHQEVDDNSNLLAMKSQQEEDKTNEEKYEQKNKESLQKLTQTSSNKSKLVFEVYQFLLNLRNKFLFQSILGLYDYTMLRNKEIVFNKEIEIREYLAGNFDIMESNLKHIQKVYQQYIEDAIRQEYPSVELNDVLKRANVKQDAATSLYNILPAMSGMMFTSPMLRNRSRSRKDLQVENKVKTSSSGNHRSLREFDFKVITLNSASRMRPTPADEGVHMFYNMLAGDELSTKNYQVVKWRIILTLVYQAILSNWNYLCYLIMILYTFINGGVIGFFYSSALIILVLVEENLPGIIFWKFCFFNGAVGFSGKLFIKVFAEKLVEADVFKKYTQTYIDNMSMIVIGSSSYVFEIVIMIFIMIQLIVADELGFKIKGMIDFEDTNTAYIRMKINKLFSLRENENFSTYKLKLLALYESIKDVDNENMGKKNIIKAQKKMASSQSKKSVFGFIKAVGEKASEKDDIDINEVIEYERSQNNKKTENLKETIKIIEKNIFIKSFGKFSEENKKSFRWQLFSVYVASCDPEPEAGG